METKEQLIHRLYDRGHITFEEVLILQRDSVGLPKLNMNTSNNIYTIKPNIKQESL